VTGTRRRGLDQPPLEGQDGYVPGDADPTGEQWVKPRLSSNPSEEERAFLTAAGSQVCQPRGCLAQVIIGLSGRG
jgi:hypothetical protein